MPFDPHTNHGADLADDCPDPLGNQDDCEECSGWGHRCPLWRAGKTPAEIAQVAAASLCWDPRQFYTQDPERHG